MVVGATFDFDPPGRTCGTNCREYLNGTLVRLTARPRPGYRLEEWALACAGADPTCAIETRGVSYARVRLRRFNLAFVTSTTISPVVLGSVERASAFCQAHADDAGLGGPYLAWLSVEGHDAVDRLATDGGWVTTRNGTVAASPEALLAGEIQAPIAWDEHGEWRSTPVATGTDEHGAASIRSTCGWTSVGAQLQTCGNLSDLSRGITLGHSTGGARAWTDIAVGSCLLDYPLLCLEAASASTPRPPALPAEAKLAFVTSNARPGDFGGATTANATCQAEAAEAGLSGRSFAALLRTPDGLTPVGAADARPWFRSDGVQVIDANGSMLPVAPISLTAGGEALYPDFVWSGGSDRDCAGWTSTVGSGGATRSNLARSDGLLLDPQSCSEPAHFICLERG